MLEIDKAVVNQFESLMKSYFGKMLTGAKAGYEYSYETVVKDRSGLPVAKIIARNNSFQTISIGERERGQ